MEFIRSLRLKGPLSRKSQFLLGPRQVGKTHLIHHEFSDIQFFDLLDQDIYQRLLRRPRLLGDELDPDARIVVIDEIQKIPALLDEVHRILNSSKQTKFLLTGSSARKLKRSGVNLLAGRAGRLEMFPLTRGEIPRFDLLTYLNRGGLPAIYLSDDFRKDLADYVNLFVKEEVYAESLVRRIDDFSRFLDVMGVQSGKELNYQEIASDSGVAPRTIANFIDVLKDTLLAFEVAPYQKTKKRKAIQRSKIFLFDVGVANAICGREISSFATEDFGSSFEHFIALELRAYLSYSGLSHPLMYWRSTTHQEVDFVVGDQIAVEVKSSAKISERDSKGLRALAEEQLIKRYLIVSRDPTRRRVADGIEALSWQDFLDDLWAGKLI